MQRAGSFDPALSFPGFLADHVPVTDMGLGSATDRSEEDNLRQVSILALAGIIGLATIGAASAESRTFELDGFERIDISTGLNAVVTFSDTFSVEAESNNPEALEKLQITTEGDTLTARLDQSFLDFLAGGGMFGEFFGKHGVTIRIALPVLTGASASSGADVDIAGATGQLTVNVSSGGDLRLTGANLETVDVNVSSGAGANLAGTCGTAKLNASSGSEIDADRLVCQSADANASSGGDISLSASRSVTANASSGGDIEISGNPAETDFDSSSGGDITLD
jgi:hypothetical protein